MHRIVEYSEKNKPAEEDIKTFLRAFSMTEAGSWKFHGDGTFFGRIIPLSAHSCYVPKDMSVYSWKQKALLRYLLSSN